MNEPVDGATSLEPPSSACKPRLSPNQMTPLWWRLTIVASIVCLVGVVFISKEMIGLRGQAAGGVLCFIGIAAMFSENLRRVNWRSIGWGIALQALLALF